MLIHLNELERDIRRCRPIKSEAVNTKPLEMNNYPVQIWQFAGNKKPLANRTANSKNGHTFAISSTLSVEREGFT